MPSRIQSPASPRSFFSYLCLGVWSCLLSTRDRATGWEYLSLAFVYPLQQNRCPVAYFLSWVETDSSFPEPVRKYGALDKTQWVRSEKCFLRAYLANTQSQQRVESKNNPLSSWKFQSRITPPPSPPPTPAPLIASKGLKHCQINTSVHRSACAAHFLSSFWHTLCF